MKTTVLLFSIIFVFQCPVVRAKQLGAWQDLPSTKYNGLHSLQSTKNILTTLIYIVHVSVPFHSPGYKTESEEMPCWLKLKFRRNVSYETCSKNCTFQQIEEFFLLTFDFSAGGGTSLGTRSVTFNAKILLNFLLYWILRRRDKNHN